MTVTKHRSPSKIWRKLYRQTDGRKRYSFWFGRKGIGFWIVTTVFSFLLQTDSDDSQSPTNGATAELRTTGSGGNKCSSSAAAVATYAGIATTSAAAAVPPEFMLRGNTPPVANGGGNIGMLFGTRSNGTATAGTRISRSLTPSGHRSLSPWQHQRRAGGNGSGGPLYALNNGRASASPAAAGKSSGGNAYGGYGASSRK